MNLQDKAKKLWELRQKIAGIDEGYRKMTDPLKTERDAMHQEIMQDFKELGTLSMRYDFATFSIAVRKTPQVVDESKIIAWLKKAKLQKEYTAVRLAPQFDALAKEAIKEGRVIDGLETKETEFMSITSSKKGDKRKVASDIIWTKQK